MSDLTEKNFFDATEEKLQAAAADYLDKIRNDPNNMSHWLPAILPKKGEMRKLAIPRTVIVPVPDAIAEAFFMDDHDNDLQRIVEFVQNEVVPKARKAGFYPGVFIKNGCFSDKFNFRLCVPGPEPMQIALSIAAINYAALCMDAGGFTEIVLRERIPYIASETPCIYNGLPLRPEFRVFYDFDNHKPLYVANYWDWDYCHEAIERVDTPHG